MGFTATDSPDTSTGGFLEGVFAALEMRREFAIRGWLKLERLIPDGDAVGQGVEV